MEHYLLVMYVTVEQEMAIRFLYTQKGWTFEKSDRFVELLRDIAGLSEHECGVTDFSEVTAISELTRLGGQSVSTIAAIHSTSDTEFCSKSSQLTQFDDDRKSSYTSSSVSLVSCVNSCMNLDSDDLHAKNAESNDIPVSGYNIQFEYNPVIKQTPQCSSVEECTLDLENSNDMETTRNVTMKIEKNKTSDGISNDEDHLEETYNNDSKFKKEDKWEGCVFAQTCTKMKGKDNYNFDSQLEFQQNIHEKPVGVNKLLDIKQNLAKKRSKRLTMVEQSEVSSSVESERVYCSDCKRYFTSKARYDLHLQKNAGKCFFECEHCEKIFYGKKSRFLIHIRSAHTKERPYVCDVCGKGYVTSDKLKIHARVHTGEKPGVCDQCGHTFYSLGQLSIHKTYHHVWKEQPHKFTCLQCNASFSSKTYLTYHLKVIHCQTRDHHCEKCDKSFKSADNLRYHIKFTHAVHKNYKCDQCDKSFKAPSGLRKHQKRHSSNREKKYMCTTCDKGFSEKHKLTMHINVHTGNKPYKCEICDFKCAFSGNLSKHKKTHNKPQREFQT